MLDAFERFPAQLSRSPLQQWRKNQQSAVRNSGGSRGFDPVADTIEFGRELIPRIKAGAIEIDERAAPVSPTR